MSRTKRDHSWSLYGWFCGIKNEAKGRDVKPGVKPPGWFKKLRQRRRRAKVKQAMRNGKDIPRFKKDDQWDWG